MFEPRESATGPGQTMAAQPTAIDMTAPLAPQPKPIGSHDAGAIRFTFNQGSSEFLYPVVVQLESDDTIHVHVDGKSIGGYDAYEEPLKINLAGSNWARLGTQYSDRSNFGLEVLPHRRFNSAATFSWSGDMRSSKFGTITDDGYVRSPVVVATLD